MRPDGSRWSQFSARSFPYARCFGCGFGGVIDPRKDFENIYDLAYYSGVGADPLIDYVSEFQHRSFGREQEYRSLLGEVVRLSRSVGNGGERLLDYGAGLGGLVRVACERGIDARGHDVGFGDDWMRDHGVSSVDRRELLAQGGAYDIVVSIDVFEHLDEPRPAVEVISNALRPGGIVVMLTGDLSSYNGRLADWSYASVPEVHVSFFTPASWDILLGDHRLESLHGAFSAPPAMIHHRIRKNLPNLQRIIPKHPIKPSAIYRMIDRKRGISAFAVGRKPFEVSK